MVEADQQIPDETLHTWQSILDPVVRLAGAHSGLISRLDNGDLEVLVSSRTPGNPYPAGWRFSLEQPGVYRGMLTSGQHGLLVPDASASEEWKDSPALQHGLISCLDFPIRLPGGKLFGTVCLLDDKPNEFSPDLCTLLENIRDLIESRLALLEQNRLLRQFGDESLLRKLLDHIPTAISCCTFAPDYRMLYLNREFVRTFGYTLTDIPTVDQWIEQAYPDTQIRPVRYQTWKDAVEEVRRRRGEAGKNEVGQHEIRVICKDGRVLNVLINTTILDEMLLISLMDISERKRAERSLLQVKEQLEATLDALPDLMFRVDAEGTIHECHSSNNDLYYVSPEAFLGKTFREVLPPKASQTISAALEEARVSGSHRGATYSLETPRGTAWFELSIACMGEAARMSGQFIVLVRDISAHKRLEQDLRESEQRFRAIAEYSYDWEVWVGTDRRTIWCNPAVFRFTGYTADEYLALPGSILSLVDVADRERVQQAREAALRGISANNIEFRLHRKDGVIQWLAVSYHPIFDDAGASLGFRASIRDINERKHAEELLRLSEERHRLLAENATDVIMTFDVQGSLTYVSPSVEKLRGYTHAEVMQQSLEDMLTPEGLAVTRKGFDEIRAAIQAGRQPPDLRCDFEQTHKDGTRMWTEVTVTAMVDAAGKHIGNLMVVRDISERKRFEDELQHARDALAATNWALEEANLDLSRLVTTDPLTGIWNRRYIQEVVGGEMAQALRYGRPLSVLMLDIDHFKAVNDTFGHDAGDQVLIELSQRIRSNLRMADQLARWGGEEFVVMAPHCRAEDAVALAEKLRQLILSQPFSEVGMVTASFGVAELKSEETPEEWFRRADMALYAAKAAGRNTVRLAE